MKLIIFNTLVFFAAGFVQAQDIEQGKKYVELKEYEKAKSVFGALVDQNPKDALAQHWLGRTFFLLGKGEKASEHCKKSIELEDQNADFHFWYGQALGQEAQSAGLLSQAFLAHKVLDQFQRTIELDPSHVGGHVGLANYYLQAPGIVGGDIAKAKEQAEILIDLGAKQGRFLLVRVLEKDDNFESVKKAYAEAEKFFDDAKDDASFFNGYGYFYLKYKKYDLAIEKFKRQVELAPKNENSYDSLGDGYRAAGRLQEALASYQKAVEINPKFEPSKKNIKEIKAELK